MAKLPDVSSKAAIRAFEKDGWEQVAGGKHAVNMKKVGVAARLAIPHPRKSLAKGTLRSLIRDAGLTPEQFRKLLD